MSNNIEKMDFNLREEREILGYVLALNIPFEIKSISDCQKEYLFNRVIGGKIEAFSFFSNSHNGMVNTDFDLDYLDDINNWRNNDETSSVFRLFLNNK